MDNKDNMILFDHNEGQAKDLAEKATEGAMRLYKDVISLSDGEQRLKAFTRTVDVLSKDGFEISSDSPLMQLAAPGNASGGNSFVGQNTFEIANQLVQDVSPDNDIQSSPFNDMLPFRTSNTVEVQQDVYSSNYGWAGDSQGVGSVGNVVPLLEVGGDTFTGYMLDNESYVSGNALIALREAGTSDTARRGLTQRLTMQQILLTMRLLNSAELMRIESINKGSFTFNGVPVSTQVPIENIQSATQSLGTYYKATNLLVPNAAATINFLKELGLFLTRIVNTGNKITKIIVENITYGAIFTTAAVEAQTRFMAANSNNTVGGIRNNAFHINTIPALQGIPIVIDNGTIKLTSEKTSLKNTRPIMWGKEVTSSSFRLIVCCAPTGLSKIGDMQFFPNVVARSASTAQGVMNSAMGPDGICMITQDLATFNVKNQQIMMYGSTCCAPTIYNPNMIFMFDPLVQIAA